MRQKGWTQRAGFLALSLVMVLVTACGGAGAPSGTASQEKGGAAPTKEEQKKGGSLIVGRSNGSDTLDPAATVAGASEEVFRYIYDTLVVKNKNGGFDGQIAEKWEASPDAKTWTFTIRKDLVFSNGDPVNADAVVFTISRILDPATKAPSRGWLGTVQKVEKVDDNTVRFVMAAPSALLLDNLSISYFSIVDPKVVQEKGADYGRNPVGSGPWKLKEWVTGDRIVLVPNDKHKGFESFKQNHGTPVADEIVFRDIPQVETQLAAIQSGEINFIGGLPGDKTPQFKDRPGFKLSQSTASVGVTYLSFGMEKGAEGQPNKFKAPFDDIKVRQAMGYAVDSQSILDKVMYGFGVRNGTPMPSGNFGYDPNALKPVTMDFNVQKAGQLLDDAGWKPGADGVREKDGKKLEISFWVLNGVGMGDVGQVIQNQLSKVGVKTKLTTLDTATYTSRVATGDMQMELLSMGWSLPNILNMQTTLGWGSGLYNNKDLAALIAKAGSTVDEGQRKQLYVQAQEMMLKDAVTIPLFSPTVLYLATDNVRGLYLAPNGAPVYDEVYVTK
jgi:peptide/nickel transport system substrate-binding protein